MEDITRIAAQEPGVVRSERVEELFQGHLLEQRKKLDHMFGWLMLGQWVLALLIAVLYSPYAWEGKTRVLHIHVELALIMGAALCSLPMLLAWTRPGAVATRHVIAVSQMLWSALLIHLTGGRIETHFHVFGSLAWLAFYLDWKVLLTATLVVVVDHLAREFFYPESVYGIVNPEAWRFLEHAFWVVFEDSILVYACFNGLAGLHKSAQREAQMEDLIEVNQNKSAALEVIIREMTLKPAGA
jgi:hypothetical protein